MDSTLQCPECSSQNKSSILKLYQISLTNAVYLCADQNCPYPVNRKWLMVERDYMELSEKKKAENLDVWLNKFIKNEKVNNTENSSSGDDFITELFKEFDGVGNDNKPNLSPDFYDAKRDINATSTSFEETIPELSLEDIFSSLDAEISSATDSISGTNDFLDEFNQHTNYGNEPSTSKYNTLNSDTRIKKENIEISGSQNLHGNNFKSPHEVDTKASQIPNDFSVNGSLHKIKTEVETLAPCGSVSTVGKLKLKSSDKFKNFKYHSVVLSSAATNI